MSRTWRGSNRKRRGRKWMASGAKAYNFGHEFEAKIAFILQDMVRDQIIDSFVHHLPHTPKKDFTIVCGGVAKDINITTSNRAWKNHYGRFGPEIEIILFSPAANDKEIKDRILASFHNYP